MKELKGTEHIERGQWKKQTSTKQREKGRRNVQLEILEKRRKKIEMGKRPRVEGRGKG